MRILLCTQYFWPENFAINHLARGLAERGFEIEVLTGMPNYPSGTFLQGYGGWRTKREEFEGIPITRVPMTARGATRASLALNYLTFAMSASMLGPALLRGPYEVVFVYAPSPATVGIPGLVLKWRHRAKLVYWVQDLWPESLQAARGTRSPTVINLMRRLVRLIYWGCDRILIPSCAFRASVESFGVDAARIGFVPNTVEEFYRPVDAPTRAPERDELGSGGFNIVFGGNLGAAQDLDTVLEAAVLTRSREDIRWVLIGDGRMRDDLDAKIRQLGLVRTVSMLGPRPPSAMPTYFALADALLLTLRSDSIYALTVPSKLQAYLACGRPVLAGIDGEAARIVGAAGAGLAVPATSPSLLADAAVRLADMTAVEREGLGASGRAYFEKHYARERVLGRLAEELREAALS